MATRVKRSCQEPGAEDWALERIARGKKLKAAMRSGMSRAANSNITARRKAKVSSVATKARPWAEPCMVKTAKRTKMATRTTHRPSIGKRASWRAVGKRKSRRKKYKGTKV